MKISRVKLSDIQENIQIRRGKYDGLREMYDSMKEDDALFVTDVKPALLYAAMKPRLVSISKVEVDGEVGYAITPKEQK